MDLLKEIEKQINTIKKVDNSSYLDAIYTHIERAEFYYVKGRTDSNYFNDVVYRSNQAYEGSLKESYKVLADKPQEEVLRKTPNEIESFFASNNIFRDRVLDLFKNYRQEWRNKSTHDYQLFFDENEAFIALTSVTSFVHLLLKQIQEKIAFNSQQRKLERDILIAKKIKNIVTSKGSEPVHKLIEVISEFAKQTGPQIHNTKSMTAIEIMGLLHAYLEAAGKAFHIQREPKFVVVNKHIRPDFLIEIDDEPIILEFKRLRAKGSIIQHIFNQVLIYMQATNTLKGVIYYAYFLEENPDIKIEKVTMELGGKNYEITTIET